MKYLAILVLTATLIVVSKAQDIKALQNRINTSGEKCRKEVGAQQDILALLNSKAIPTNEKQRCFLECVYKDLALVKDNKFNEEGATALAKQRFGTNKDQLTKADAVIKKCKNEVVIPKNSTERCTLGRLLRNCVVNHAGDLQVFTKNN
uniref:Odorant binding protein 5 n=1 Tax=Drosicha corpulenta TaxID=535978 RepID=A0A0U3TUZ9_9HEMI|nr:odorant binding protein 5 [Drosicha corpulenta]